MFGSYLFLSCDLVGSTAFKHDRYGSGDWDRPFQDFYLNFPQSVQGHCEGSDLRLWKAIGDELVFFGKVKSEADVYRAVNGWLRAMEHHQEFLDTEGVPLALKGGCFLATFPAPDRSVEIPSGAGMPDTTRDFIGPSIDTGFRVFAQSDRRFFTMSMEAAWAYCLHLLQTRVMDMNLRYVGEQEMKGVWGGNKYPIVAVDRQAGQAVLKAIDALSGVTAPDPQHIVDLCCACANQASWASGIYLEEAIEERLRRPHDLEKMLMAREKVEPARDPQAQAPENYLGDQAPEGAPLRFLGHGQQRIEPAAGNSHATVEHLNGSPASPESEGSGRQSES